MPDTDILNQEQVAEIEAANEAHRVDWRYPNQKERVRALCRTLRAVWAERLEIQRALASSVLNDPTEDDSPPYSTTELVQGIGWIIRMKEATQQRNIALREQLAESARRHFNDVRSLQQQRDEVAERCREIRQQLAQVEKERDALRDDVERLARAEKQP